MIEGSQGLVFGSRPPALPLWVTFRSRFKHSEWTSSSFLLTRHPHSHVQWASEYQQGPRQVGLLLPQSSVLVVVFPDPGK